MGAGRRVTLTVDPRMVEEAGGTPGEVYGDLDRLVRPDLRHHYATPLGAQRWLDVCADPGYGHQELLRLVARTVPGLADALTAAGIGTRLAVTSLGPGDGSVDEVLLRGLARSFELCAYGAVDSSMELLRRSLRRLAHTDGLPTALPLHGVLGDIRAVTSLPGAPTDPPASRLLVLTGFTLGNYPERELLDGVRALMGPDDLLLLDARLHPFGALPDDLDALRAANGALFGSYDLPSVRRFVFGPLEVATTAVVEDVRVDFDVTRDVTLVPDALNLLIHCRGLDTVLRLPGTRVRRERLDLAVTTLYDLDALLAWLAEAGLPALWHRAEDQVAFLLVRRS